MYVCTALQRERTNLYVLRSTGNAYDVISHRRLSGPRAPQYLRQVYAYALNPSKTQLIWLGTRQQILKLDFALLAAQFPQFTFLTSVRDLGYSGQHSFFLSSHL